MDMPESNLHPDFKDFLKLLNDYRVEYLLIGGYAVSYYGYVRPTGDMDIWIAVRPDNAEKVVGVFEAFGLGSKDLSASLFLKDDQIIRVGMPPIRIEVMTTIDGVAFEECYRARVSGVIDGVEATLISLPHLKQNKQASGRFKDLNDLENLP